MIIKLPIPFVYARHKEARTTTPSTHTERVKADRFVMILLFLLTVVGAVIYA